MPDSNWKQATAEPSDELLSLILMLVAEYLNLVGRFPTVAELKHAVRHPGS
jgi:hypothetical protein